LIGCGIILYLCKLKVNLIAEFLEFEATASLNGVVIIVNQQFRVGNNLPFTGKSLF
jgi:hypothetical protein